MPLTPETLPRHELAGLRVRVVESTDPGRVGVEGRVVRETANTLVVEVDRRDSGVSAVQVPKRGTTFEFALEGTPDTDEAAGDREAPGTAVERPSETTCARDGAGQSDGCEAAAYVTVDGEVLLSRPARRTERGVDSTWH